MISTVMAVLTSSRAAVQPRTSASTGTSQNLNLSDSCVCARRNAAAENARKLLAVRPEVKLLDHPLTPGLSEPPSHLRVADKRVHRIRKTFLVGRRDQKAVCPVPDQLRNTRNMGGNARHLHSHGFHQHDRYS